VQLKTAAGKQYEIQVSNNGSIGPTFNAKSADPSEYKSDNSEGAGSNIETLIKVEGP
jgi:hypothetical protein